MKKEHRGGVPLAGLTVAAILLASTAGYVSALSRMFQAPVMLEESRNDFLADADVAAPAAKIPAASFEQSLGQMAAAWLVNALPSYSSGRAREMWYLSLDSSGDRRASEFSGGSNAATYGSFAVSNAAQSNSLAPVTAFVSSRSSATPPVLGAPDAEVDWGNTGTSWTAGASWGGTAPVAGDVAWFKVVAVTNPALGTAAVSIAGLYFSSTASSGYSITRTSPGAFTLTGYATSIGAETGDANAVAIGANNTSGTNTFTVPIALAPASGTTSTFFQAAGGQLIFNSSTTVISGSGILLNLTGGGTMSFGAVNTYSGGTTVAGPTVINAGTGAIFGTGTLELNSGTYRNSTSGTPRTLSNLVSITGDFTFDSGGSGGTNVFTGGGSTTGNRTLTMNTTTTSFTTSAFALGGDLTLQGTGAATFSGGLALGGADRIVAGGMTGALTISGGITGTGNLTLDANTAAAITISTVSANNVGSITNAGTGGGTTTISGGIGSNVTGITENSTTSALTISTTAITVNSGGTTLTNSSGTKLLTVSGGTTGTGNLILNNNSSTDAGITLSTTSVNNTGTVTNSGTGSGSTIISAVIGSNVTGVTENSANSTLLLSAQNTYSGPTNLTLGNITLGASSTLTANVLTSGPVGTGTFHIGSGTNAATLSGSISGTRTIQNNISLDGDVTFAPGSGQTTGRIALDVFTGLTTANTFALTRTNQLTVSTGETVDLIGSISGAGFGITKLGPGTLNLGNGSATDANANTYTGLTTVSGGLVNLRKASGTDAIAGNLLIDTTGTVALGNSNVIKDTSDVTVNGGGTFDLSGRSEAINALNGSGTITNNSTLGVTSSTLTTGSNDGGGTFSGVIQNGAATKTVALTKTGSGTLTLTNSNSYSGTTIINGGTLELKNTSSVALSGTSSVAVNSGGTLLFSANNQINQAVFPGITVDNGKLDAGGFSQGTGGTPAVANSGAIGLGALTMNSSSVIDLTGTSIFHFSNSSGSTWTGTLSIWDWSGLAAGGGTEQILFGGDATGLSAAQLLQVSFYSDGGGTLISNTALILADGEIVPGPLVVVPEPSTWIGAALALGAVACAQRRKLRKLLVKG